MISFVYPALSLMIHLNTPIGATRRRKRAERKMREIEQQRGRQRRWNGREKLASERETVKEGRGKC
jgi:hypothetical protein